MGNLCNNAHKIPQATIGSITTVFKAQSGFSYKQIASMAGIEPRTLEAIASGDQRPNLDTFFRLAKVFGKEYFNACAELYGFTGAREVGEEPEGAESIVDEIIGLLAKHRGVGVSA
jgi:transcriptional regulator with XRE-family HTH domain